MIAKCNLCRACVSAKTDVYEFPCNVCKYSNPTLREIVGGYSHFKEVGDENISEGNKSN